MKLGIEGQSPFATTIKEVWVYHGLILEKLEFLLNFFLARSSSKVSVWSFKLSRRIIWALNKNTFYGRDRNHNSSRLAISYIFSFSSIPTMSRWIFVANTGTAKKLKASFVIKLQDSINGLALSKIMRYHDVLGRLKRLGCIKYP